MAAQKWRMVRLRLETIARLEEYRRRLEQQDELGTGPGLESGRPGGGPASLDALVNKLLDEPVAKRERARKSRARRRQLGNDGPDTQAAG